MPDRTLDRSRTARNLRRWLMLVSLLGGLLALASGSAGAQGGGHVSVLTATGVVDQVMATYLRDSVVRAANEGAAAVVIRLDTPGGSLDATRSIVSSLLESRVPVIVWVAPAGARAASAGTFITLAGNIAAMAPGTNIGAATPVGAQGEDIEGAMGDKVMNDTVASITALAEARGRPVDWAVSTVTEARSDTVDEAIAAGAVDLKAASITELLAAVDGRTVETAAGPVTLDLADAPVVQQDMNPLQAFLHLLADPNIAFILFTLGFYGLLFELQNPNFVTGILGAFALILAFIGFGSLPLNVAGLLLVGLAIILFVLELTVTSHGLLAIGGLVAFLLGASALYTEPGTPTAPSVEVALPVILAMTALTALFVGVVLWAAVRTRRMPPVNTGLVGSEPVETLVGTPGDVRRPLMPLGSVYAAGEEWSARSVDGHSIDRGEHVRIVGHDGLTLIVERVAAGPSVAPAAGSAS
jgi:membrane-bound serine protease (ClpP class)